MVFKISMILKYYVRYNAKLCDSLTPLKREEVYDQITVTITVLTLSRREPYAAVGLLSLTSQREFKVHQSSSEQNFLASCASEHKVVMHNLTLINWRDQSKRICSIEKWLILSSTKERRHSRHPLTGGDVKRKILLSSFRQTIIIRCLACFTAN